MKNIITISITLTCLLFIISPAFGQSANIETAEFKVSGVCEMCKTRIENAALIKGVKFAEWTQDSQTLKVIFKPSKASLDQIHQALAGAGHSTDKVLADEKAYKKLPACCLYNDGVESH